MNVINKDIVTIETCSSNSEATSDEEINKLEKAFGKLQRIYNKKPDVIAVDALANLRQYLLQRLQLYYLSDMLINSADSSDRIFLL
jgi:hypothetical protein